MFAGFDKRETQIGDGFLHLVVCLTEETPYQIPAKRSEMIRESTTRCRTDTKPQDDCKISVR